MGSARQKVSGPGKDGEPERQGRGRSRGRWGRWGRGGGHERRMGGEEEEEELPSLIAAIFNGNIITELTVFPKW